MIFVLLRTCLSKQKSTEYVVKCVLHSSCNQVEPAHSKYASPDQRPHYGSYRSSSPLAYGEFYSILVSGKPEFTRSVFLPYYFCR